MPAGTGAGYIAGLRERAADVYLEGERVQDVMLPPALQSGVRTLAPCAIGSTIRSRARP